VSCAMAKAPEMQKSKKVHSHRLWAVLVIE
jgi:hypothetical protein